jgi:hypothetical protein
MKKRPRISLSEGGDSAESAAVKNEFRDCWPEIEKTYGRSLTDQTRQAILLAIHSLLDQTAVEQNTPLQKNIAERIRNLRCGALAFKALLNSRTLSDQDNRAVVVLVDNEIKALDHRGLISVLAR